MDQIDNVKEFSQWECIQFNRCQPTGFRSRFKESPCIVRLVLTHQPPPEIYRNMIKHDFPDISWTTINLQFELQWVGLCLQNLLHLFFAKKASRRRLYLSKAATPPSYPQYLDSSANHLCIKWWVCG